MSSERTGSASDVTQREFVGGQRLFGRYTLIRILGRGGMGIVWLAHDEELERDVALKFLPDLIIHDAAVLSDLKRETRRCLELTHKNIVRIYDFVHDERSGCISMEYIDGDTLSNLRCDKERKVFETAELTDWLSQLCDALDYAHNYAHIIHRDLKPANLMVNQRGELKVSDFGIARSLGDSMSVITMAGGRSGTLAYMSPQQLEGERGTHLDDIYSLGASVYELLTSKPPFYAGNIDRQIREKIPPSMTERRKEFEIEAEPIPAVWEEWVAACLAKDPGRRPQSVTDIARQLQMASAEGHPPAMRPFFPRSKKRVLVLALASLCLLALAVGGWYFGVLKPAHAKVGAVTAVSTATAIPEKSIAVLPFENLSSDPDNAYFATGIQDEILTRLAKVAALKVISHTSTQQYAARPGNLSEIARQLGVANILEGSVQKAADQVHINAQLIRAATGEHLWAESYDRKLENIFGVEAEVASSVAEALKAKLTGAELEVVHQKPTNNPEAYDAYLRGIALSRHLTLYSDSRAIKELEEAVHLDPNFALAWALLSRVNSSASLYWDATGKERTAAQKSFETALRLQPDLPEAQLAQAYYQYWVLRDYEAARRNFEQLRIKLPNSADVPEALGLISRRQGRWDESRIFTDEAIALNPRDTLLWLEAAWVRHWTRDFAAALKYYDQGLNISPDAPRLIAGKALLYQSLGELDRADALLQELRPTADNPWGLNEICYEAILRRRYAPAITLLQDWLAEADRLDALTRNVYRRLLGDLLRLSGNSVAAKASYSQARDEVGQELRRRREYADDICEELALIYAGLGDREQALKYADDALDLMPFKDALVTVDREDTRARIAARFGLKDIAIPLLERLLKTPGGDPPLTPALLRLDPDFDPLRGDPRFEKLAASPAPKE